MTTPRERLKAARARVREQRHLKEALHLERRAELLESGQASPSSFDFVNAYSIILDRFRSEPWSYSVTNPFDRKWGRNFPIYQSEPELSLLRAPSRVLCQTNTYAQALLGGLKSYIIGPGYSYRAHPRDNADCPPGLPEAVQAIAVDPFLRRNQWNAADPWQMLDELPLRPIEGEAFERSLRDGEAGLLHYADPDSGDTDVRWFESEYVTQPPSSRWDEWSFGIQTPANDEQTKIAFWISFTGNKTDGEEYPVRDISWLTRNSDRIAKRGVPDFTFDAYDALYTAQKLRRNLSVGGAQKAAIVGVRQHQAQTQTQVSSFQQALTDLQQVNLVTGQQKAVRLFEPGEWEDIPENLEYVGGPSTANEGALVEVLNACLRGAVVRWNGFEWLVSADASSNSYANALAAKSPAVQRVDCEQGSVYKPFFLRSIAIAIRNKADAGQIKCNGHTYSFDEIRKYVEIQCEAPSPVVEDETKEAQNDSVYSQLGVKSIQTICQEQGLDYEREMQNIQEHQARFGQPGQGLDPNNPEGGDDEQGSGGQNGKPSPKPVMPPAKMPAAPKMPEGTVIESSLLEGWITLSDKDDEGTKHGSTHVFIGPRGEIQKGPRQLTGKKVSELSDTHKVTATHGDTHPETGDKEGPKATEPHKGKTNGNEQGIRGRVKGGGGASARKPEETGGGVEDQARRSGDATAAQKGSGQSATADHSEVDRIGRRLDRYKAVFEKGGSKNASEWLDLLKEHIAEVGPEQALASLGEAKIGGVGKVQYEGGYDELSESKQEADFIKAYLDKAGITLVTSTSTIDPNSPLVSSFSKKNLEALGRKRDPKTGDYIPSDQTFKDKLEESQHLPGLESSEDVDKVVGSKVTQFTPEVIAKFDDKYGKGQWIVKSYGAEAYAGFGIFFPQRTQQIQQDAKASMAEAKSGLKKRGYTLVRDEAGNVSGITDGKQVYAPGTAEFDGLDKTTKRMGKQAVQASHAEKGARLPTSPEDSIKNDYGISFRRGADGAPVGITDRDGRDYNFDDPKIKAVEEMDGGAAGYAIHRAQEADQWRREGFQTEPKFMVQPAFKAVGVSDYDRAMGNTWETAKEGRVHVTTAGGKASAVPYATLVGRGDDLPAVFPSEDSKAMEQAVEDAINQLPESERTGQLYAPDVMKTKDGWKVLELNPSAEGGGSDWLGRNPFVIDALASHMTGREPAHVQFIRKLLKGKGVKGAQLSESEEQPREAAGSSKGGQFARKGGVGGVRVVTHGSLKSKYSLHTDKRVPGLKLKNYKQKDIHSCGFVAALTVADYLGTGANSHDVLKAVRPTKSGGISGPELKRALAKIGVKSEFRSDLSIPKLRKLVGQGIPVLITVYPDDWSSDHWTVVQGIDDERVYLTNYKSLTIEQFKREWFDRGEGLVCSPSGRKKLSESAEEE